MFGIVAFFVSFLPEIALVSRALDVSRSISRLVIVKGVRLS
jgi:hypothetical protein